MALVGPILFPTDLDPSYIGHLVWTMTLLPLLKRTAREPNSDVRIVDVRNALRSSREIRR